MTVGELMEIGWMSTPRRANAVRPETIETGVEITNAHGQAIINTAVNTLSALSTSGQQFSVRQ